MADGYIGAIARHGGRCVGLMCGRADGETAFLPADGVAVDPDLDPTPVVVGLFAALAPVLLEAGALRHLINHVALAPLSEAFNNLGFGRGSVFGTQPAQPFAPHPDIEVRVGEEADLDVIADLSHVELLHRSTPPVYAPPLPNTLADTRARHRRLMDAGAVHLLARLDGEDVGLLTLETTSPAPRLCPDGRALHRADRDRRARTRAGRRHGAGAGRPRLGPPPRPAHGLGRLRLAEPPVPAVLDGHGLRDHRLRRPSDARRRALMSLFGPLGTLETTRRRSRRPTRRPSGVTKDSR